MSASHHAAYKRFIDELVELSRDCTAANRIRKWGHTERTNENTEYPLDEQEVERKKFVLGLSAKEKLLLAELLDDQYVSAIHDVASFLEGRLTSDNMKINWNGEEVPASPYASMHYDFICRQNGDKWPDEES